MSAPSFTSLQDALTQYKTALNCLETSYTSLQKEQIIKILSARYALGKTLEAAEKIPPHILSELIELDSYLKKQAYKITQVPDLPEYQSSLPTTSQAWLLELEIAKKSHPWKKFEVLLKWIKILFLTVSLALLATLGTRFLTAGTGLLEVAFIAFPSLLSVLEIKKEVTENEKKRFYNILNSFKKTYIKFISFPIIPSINSGFITILKYFAILISSFLSSIFSLYFLFLLIILVIWFKQPNISEVYKKTGKTHQDNQQLVVAEQNYLKAVALDSDNFDAHYKLATLYEDLQDIDKAKKEYLIAAKGGHLDAYNNLAYWYIRQDKDAEAINLLNKGLKFVAEREKNLEQLTDEEKLDLKLLQYNLYKNLGWARFEQKRDEYARPYLLTAINIVERAKTLTYLGKRQIQYIHNPGAAYCLYANAAKLSCDR